jgi:ribosome-binding protein aMBF1 (putative translation factor)
MNRSLGLRRRARPGRADYEDLLEKELARLTTQVTDEITWHIRTLGLSRVDLATRMGVSPGWVNRVLSGGENITLRTLAGLAAAVEARFELQLRRGDRTAGQHHSRESSTRPQPSTL